MEWFSHGNIPVAFQSELYKNYSLIKEDCSCIRVHRENATEIEMKSQLFKLAWTNRLENVIISHRFEFFVVHERTFSMWTNSSQVALFALMLCVRVLVFKTDKITFTGGHFNLFIMKKKSNFMCSMQIHCSEIQMTDRPMTVKWLIVIIIKAALLCFASSSMMEESHASHTKGASTPE